MHEVLELPADEFDGWLLFFAEQAREQREQHEELESEIKIQRAMAEHLAAVQRQVN